MKFRLLPIVDEYFAKDISKLDRVAARVVEAVPDYDEDYEVLIARVENTSKVPHYCFDEGKPAFINISIHNLDCVYPITERGKRLLQGRLDSNINLAEPIFESYINASVQRRQSSSSLMGGAALLKIAGLDMAKYQDTIKLLEDDALSGASRSNRGEQFPLDGTLIENLMCYSRHEVMPTTDIGYFYDFGVLVSKLYSGKDDIAELLDKYRSCLKGIAHDNKSAKLYYLLEKADDVTSLFDSALKIKLSAVSIIIFLKLQSELYQHQNLDKTRFKELVANLVQVRERDIALALWLVGVCFGFEFFCANYYEATQPGFFLKF
ncbi:MAG: hypothetical protein PUP93_25440 [Rhizonema sp. NSF051]|nr:hypothetical protein [Rhizonema sp. NSF051]